MNGRPVPKCFRLRQFELVDAEAFVDGLDNALRISTHTVNHCRRKSVNERQAYEIQSRLTDRYAAIMLRYPI